MSNRPQKTVISKTYKSLGPDGRLKAYRKTEEIVIGGNKTVITTHTSGSPAMQGGKAEELPWRTMSPASDTTEEVLPRSGSSSSFGDSTLYGDDWSSVTSDSSDHTSVRQAQLVSQTSFFRPFSAISDERDRDRAPSAFSNKSNVASNFGKVDLASSRQQALEMHNDYRALHGAPPLVLDDQLNAYAQEWAEHLASTDVFEHRPRDSRKYGENLFYGMNSRGIKPEEAVKSWYNECKDYDFNRPGFAGNTGHFTQVVWKESRRLGLGIAQPNSTTVYVVGNYDPPGNIIGADNFRRNVSPKE